MQPRSIAVPAEMDPAAIKFVCKFAEAMAIELHQAQLQDSHRDVRLDLAPAVPA